MRRQLRPTELELELESELELELELKLEFTFIAAGRVGFPVETRSQVTNSPTSDAEPGPPAQENKETDWPLCTSASSSLKDHHPTHETYLL